MHQHIQPQIISSSRSSNNPQTFTIILHLLCIAFLYFFIQIQENTFIELSIKISDNYYPSNDIYRYILEILKNIGSLRVITFLWILIYLWFPIAQSYTFMTINIYSWYIICLFDLLYGPRRPNEENLNVYFKNGNEKPASHSSLASSILLPLRYIIISKIKESKLYIKNKDKIHFKLIDLISVIIVIFILFLVVFSQVALKEHSINMCLVGILIGYILYVVIYLFFNLHAFSGEKFFKMFRKKRISSNIFFAYIIAIFVLLALYYAFERHFVFFIPTIKLINQKQTYFNQYALSMGMFIFLPIGTHYGLEYLERYIQDKYPGKEGIVNCFNQVSKLKKLGICFVMLIYNISWILFFVCNESKPFIVRVIGTIFPCFMTGYIFFGIGIVACIQINLVNKEINAMERDFDLIDFSESNTNVKDDSIQDKNVDDDEEDDEEEENEDKDSDNEDNLSEGLIDEYDSNKIKEIMKNVVNVNYQFY